MRGTITSIIEEKAGRQGEPYVRLTFRMKPDYSGKNDFWAKTDLCPSFRNFKKWEPYLHPGAHFHNLTLKDPKTVDADSDFIYYCDEPYEELPPPPPDPQMTLL